MSARELALDVLLQINEDGQPSHAALGAVLAKYQFLPKQERAFLTRLVEGVLEYRIRLDYVIDQTSKVAVSQMKPPIRELLRSGTYQILFMDHVPDAAACNETVALAQKRGFYHLKPFVNGVLRSIARNREKIVLPSRQTDPVRSLSVEYSMPEELVMRWLKAYGPDTCEAILRGLLEERPTTIRCRMQSSFGRPEDIAQMIRQQGALVQKAPYLPYAYYLSGYDHLNALAAFREGRIMVQDVSSMLASVAAGPKRGDHILDVCAAPGGKSLHLGDLMEGFGSVEARDVSQAKVDLIEENIARTGSLNVTAKVQDAAVFDPDSELCADIVLADVPCSGYGVIGKKPDIKYRTGERRPEDLVPLQRRILDCAAEYVKPKGVLLYSTCTITKEENEENMRWFLENHSFVPESLDAFLPEELHCDTSALGYLQLLPGVHPCDGFFMARFRRK